MIIAVNKHGDHRNWDLLNRANYEEFDSVKEMMCLYTALEKWAHWETCGDRISSSIFIDMQNAIYDGSVLTIKQREVVELICYYHFTFEMVSEYLRINKSNVSRMFDRAVERIQEALLSGRIFYIKQQQIAKIPYCNHRGRVDRWMMQKSGL